MAISIIEVSLFPSESALFKYAIKLTTIIFEKRLILGWWITYSICIECSILNNYVAQASHRALAQETNGRCKYIGVSSKTIAGNQQRWIPGTPKCELVPPPCDGTKLMWREACASWPLPRITISCHRKMGWVVAEPAFTLLRIVVCIEIYNSNNFYDVYLSQYL